MTKHSQNVCLISAQISTYINMPNVIEFSDIPSRKSCMSGISYLYQTFINFVSNQYRHFDISTCQMRLQVVEGSPL